MRIILSVLLSLASLSPLVAQSGLGIVRGTAIDTTGSVIPKAKVRLENKVTGVAQTTETSAVGVYYFGGVQPAPYILTIEAPGFKKWSGTFVLEAGQTASIDAPMEVGSVDTVVEVCGRSPGNHHGRHGDQ